MVINIQVNTVSGNGLLPDSTNPLPEPVLTWASLGLCGNHLRPMSLEVLKISDHKIGLKNTLVKLFLHLLRVHEFKLGVVNRFAFLYLSLHSVYKICKHVCLYYWWLQIYEWIISSGAYSFEPLNFIIQHQIGTNKVCCLQVYAILLWRIQAASKWSIDVMLFKYSCSKFHDYGVLLYVQIIICPDNMVHGANMGPTWVLSAPCGPHKPCCQDVFCICHSCAVFSKMMLWNTYSNEIPLCCCCYGILNRYTTQSMYSVLVKCKNIQHFSHDIFSAVLYCPFVRKHSKMRNCEILWASFKHMWYYWLF